MKNFLIIIFLLELSISQNDIITDTESCSPCTDPNAACTSGTGCECNTGYRFNEDYSACIADTATIISGSNSCSTNDDCGADSHATCVAETGCKCNDGYRLNNDNSACVQNTASILTGTNSCTAPCADSHATCAVGTGCKCNDGYQLNDGKTACVTTPVTPADIITGTNSCSTNDDCGADSHATCTVGTGCKCNDGYQLNDGKSACVTTPVTPADIITGTSGCSTNNDCGADSHSTCTVGTGCKCDTGYQLNDGKSACVTTPVTPTSDIITGTDSCTAAAGCQDSHATCTVGTGCKCNDGYQLNQAKTACEAKSGSGSGTGSGNNENDSDDSSSFLKYSLLAVLSLLF